MENINDYSKKQADMCIDNDSIPKALYTDYGVKKGLRDEYEMAYERQNTSGHNGPRFRQASCRLKIE